MSDTIDPRAFEVADMLAGDRHLLETMSNFEWPCDKRIAHGKHAVVAWRETGSETASRVNRTCPGVAAHPAVMIGRTVKPS